MAELTLSRVGTGGLYAPPGAAATYARFVLWDATDAPSTIPASDTWPRGAVPPRLGWWVFSDADLLASGFEPAVREALGNPPPATGVAWLRTGQTGLRAVGIVAIGADAPGPAVAQTVKLELPPGVRGVEILAGARVWALLEADGQERIVFGCPPLPDGPIAVPEGLEVPLADAACGALRFLAFVPASEPEASEALVRVQVDPVRPFAPRRTFQAYTGRSFRFVDEGGTFWLVPAGASRARA